MHLFIETTMHSYCEVSSRSKLVMPLSAFHSPIFVDISLPLDAVTRAIRRLIGSTITSINNAEDSVRQVRVLRHKDITFQVLYSHDPSYMLYVRVCVIATSTSVLSSFVLGISLDSCDMRQRSNLTIIWMPFVHWLLWTQWSASAIGRRLESSEPFKHVSIDISNDAYSHFQPPSATFHTLSVLHVPRRTMSRRPLVWAPIVHWRPLALISWLRCFSFDF